MRKEKFKCPLIGVSATDDDYITVATIISTNSGMDTRCPAMKQPKLPKTAQERIEALRKAGVDVSNLFAIQGANGGEFIASNKDGKLTMIDDETIYKYISSQGTVPNRRLFRRWVMAQMFHMMSYVPFGESEPIGVTEMIHRLGYEYQWKMLLNELRAQMKMEGKDFRNFADRNRWFNVGVVATMARDYIEELKKQVYALPNKHFRGKAYKHIGNRDIFVSELQAKLYNQLQKALTGITYSTNAAQLYTAAKHFNDIRFKMSSDTPQSKAWIDAYKGSGAFFTMQNLIQFHNCIAYDDRDNRLDQSLSLAFISLKAEEYKNGKGWCLLAVLKKMLKDNNINVKEKVAEWRSRK